MLVGLMVPHVRPVGTLSVRVTVPPNPFSDVIVILEEAGVPVFEGAGEVTEMPKSVMVNMVVAEWDREPDVPVIVSV